MVDFDIVEKKNATFRGIFAYVVIYEGRMIGSVSINNHPRAVAYVTYKTYEIREGFNLEYSIQEHSAAVKNAVEQVEASPQDEVFCKFVEAIKNYGERGWFYALKDAGFRVYKAI